MKIIEVENLSFKYKRSQEYALKNINLKIDEGEIVLLTGPSGCGKSTLLRAINGLIPHFYPGEYRGRVIVHGKIVSETPVYEMAKIVGMVFQNPENQLFASTVEREIVFGLENLHLSREEINKRLNNVLKLLNIEHLRNRPPFELSGGQQQKVAIASVIALQPKVLILDEPTSNLDPLSAIEILQTVLMLRKKLGITVIIVEHRLELVSPIVDRIVIMKNGRIFSEGDPREILYNEVAERAGIGIPKIIKIINLIKQNNKDINISEKPLTPEEFIEIIRGYI